MTIVKADWWGTGLFGLTALDAGVALAYDAATGAAR